MSWTRPPQGVVLGIYIHNKPRYARQTRSPSISSIPYARPARPSSISSIPYARLARPSSISSIPYARLARPSSIPSIPYARPARPSSIPSIPSMLTTWPICSPAKQFERYACYSATAHHWYWPSTLTRNRFIIYARFIRNIMIIKFNLCIARILSTF